MRKSESFFQGAMSCAVFLLACSCVLYAQENDVIKNIVPDPPYRMWYQPGLMHLNPQLYEHMNLDAGGTVDPMYGVKKGVACLLWAYGPNHPDDCGEIYFEYRGLPSNLTVTYETGEKVLRPGTAIDEWLHGADAKKVKWASDGLRKAKKQWPDTFFAVWCTVMDDRLIELVKDGTVDLIMYEGYTFRQDPFPVCYPLFAWPMHIAACEKAKKAGVLDKTIFCFGHVSADPAKDGSVLDVKQFENYVREIKGRYPEMPGIGFFQGHGVDSPENIALVEFCDRLSGELYPAEDKAYSEPAGDFLIDTSRYIVGGLFTDTVIPVEGQEVKITVRAECVGETPETTRARIIIVNQRSGEVAFDQRCDMVPSPRKQIWNDKCEFVDTKLLDGVFTWKAGANGMYKVTAVVDCDGEFYETSEANNIARLDLPVVIAARKPEILTYYKLPYDPRRWTTVVTNAYGDISAMTERGITPLMPKGGGLSHRGNFNTARYETEGEKYMQEFIGGFVGHYTDKLPEGFAGIGCDEFGGYPESTAELASIASGRALKKVKELKPDRTIAIWHAGGVNSEIAKYYRDGADFVLLETYVFNAIPNDLQADDIYVRIKNRIDPFMRESDSLLPVYGSRSKTVIAVDLAERPDLIEIGELEQVVKYVRRIAPELRGMGWYTGGFGSFGAENTPENYAKFIAVLKKADEISLDYYIKPCLTFMPYSVWVDGSASSRQLVCALSNIGAMDSAPVEVEVFVDGNSYAVETIRQVPAGRNRHHDRALVRVDISKLPKGTHDFKVRIKNTSDKTIDPEISHSAYLE